MDTQRLILFVIFSFSALLLWEAWQKEHATAAARRRVARRRSRRRATDLPPAPAPRRRPRPPARAGASPARRRPRRRSRGGRGRTITITTDLYRAEIDTTGGAITAGRAAQAPRSGRRGEAVPRAAEDARAHVRRAVGTARRGHAEPPHRLRGAAGPARARAGRGPARAPAAGGRAERRQDRAGADVPSRQLRDRRRLRHHQHRHRADRAVRVFPADARHQDAGRAELDGAGLLHRPGRSTTRPTSSRRSSSASSTSWPPTRRASCRTPRTPTTAGSAMVEHYFVAAWLPSRREEDAARVLRAQARRRPLLGRRDRAGRHDRAGRDRRRPRAALRRAAGAGRARASSPRASTSSSTTASSPSSRRRSSGCSSGCTASSTTGAGRSCC